MPQHEVIIVGSGAAGTWAAAELARQKKNVLVLDVGHRPPPGDRLTGNFHSLRKTDDSQGRYLIGEAFESLHNISGDYLSPKLKSPRFRFVTAQAGDLCPVTAPNFTAVQSLAFGGLANAWGAGAYRYTQEDLAGFPVSQNDLDPFYDEITEKIGISGAKDDLSPYFGSARGLQPAHPMDRISETLMTGYGKKRTLFRKHHFSIGVPRLAVLSRPLGDRPACPYDNLTFWEPKLDYLYTPALTLAPLIERKSIQYADKCLVTRYEEKDGEVLVFAKHSETGEERKFTAKRLILAAGALNSARLALASHHDYASRLPILDNLISMTPFLRPTAIGQTVDSRSHGLAQLNMVYDGPKSPERLQATLYSFQSLLSSEVIMDFPLALRGNLAACRQILPALLLVTFFYPDSAKPENFLQLEENGSLKIKYDSLPEVGEVENELISVMRRLFFLSHRKLVRPYRPGNGIHYGGTLPMGRTGRYACGADGRLNADKLVYVADGAAFPRLAAKNHTLTIMANAMRVAREAGRSLGGGS